MDLIGIVYALVSAAIFGWFFLRYFPSFDRKVLLFAWTMKVIGTFVLLALFTYHYTDRSTSDLHRFFDDGLRLKGIAGQNPIDFLQILFGWDADRPAFRIAYFEHFNAWIKPYDSGFYNDNHIMIRLNAAMAFLSFERIEVHSIWFSFLSFLGVLYLIKSLIPDQSGSSALIIVTLFPSQLIWLSGGLKESVLVFGLGLLLYGLLRAKRLGKLWATLLIGLGGIVLIQVKLYYILFLIPLLIWQLISSRLKLKPVASYSLLLILALTGITALEVAGISPMEHIVRKQHEFLNHTEEINPGSAFEISRLDYSYTSLFFHLPEALINSTLKPFPWNADQTVYYLLVLENILIISALIIMLFSILKNHATLYWPRWLIPYTLALLILIGLITPVYGALMRYRAPILILLLIAFSPFIQTFIQRLRT